MFKAFGAVGVKVGFAERTYVHFDGGIQNGGRRCPLADAFHSPAGAPVRCS